ncbi:ferritin-like domain-containing protein [Dendrosporobacter sp. 1207_IL3150]|uniref:ferritin-like domain-containing protein n=1 Tax=Dendrosporobacter sp. 1207_IL3150 TaxID=3084054 RepID=UPI002FD8DB81
MTNTMLTQKERSYLEDALEMENFCISKYNVYADQCQDPDLKDIMFSISKNKRQHANRIKQLLGKSVNTYQ